MAESRAEVATLGGGCFWCLDAAYREIAGVLDVTSGYAGGTVPDPTYEQVCTGRTGHAEVVRVTFDPDVVSYRDLLEIFFTIHDPTTLNRQGADVGTQYRSVIFYHDEDQRRTAESVIAELEAAGTWDSPVVTEVAPVPGFHPAEEYHQRYFERNPGQGYCQVVIAPKLAKLRERYRSRLRTAGERAPSGADAADGDAGAGGSTDRRSDDRQVRPYLTEPRNPLDQGGITD